MTFKTTDQNYNDVERIMRVMIPCLEVVKGRDACQQADAADGLRPPLIGKALSRAP